MPTLRHLTAFIGAAAARPPSASPRSSAAGTAGATAIDDIFISVLADEGIEAPSTRKRSASPTTSARCSTRAETLSTPSTAVSDYTDLEMEDSAFFVGASVATYCPEHEAAIG